MRAVLTRVKHVSVTIDGKVHGRKVLTTLLIAGFIGLQMCWWGVNYLPSAQGSQHVYSNSR